MSEEMTKYTDLMERAQKASDLKIRLEERLKNEKAQLEKLLKEIQEKGFDPKKLTQIREEKEAELTKLMKELEEKMKDTEQRLNTIEADYDKINS